MKNRQNINEYHRLPILDGLEILNAKSCTSDFPFHAHETYNISLILNTTFSTKLSNKLLKAPVGTLSITNSQEVHATPCDKDLGNSFVTYYVSSEVLRKLNGNESVFFEDKVIYDKKIFDELYFLSFNLENSEIQFERRLLRLLRLLISKYATIKPLPDSTNRLFQSFINERTFDAFSLEKTASQFGINKFKFIRLFKQETGLTPNNFVLLRKVEQSKNLLKKGNPIFDVAIDCGFYDTSHFYKNFKRFIGVNPLEFQNAFFPV